MKLSDIKIGGKGKVLSIDIANPILKRHILEMGLTRNTIARVVRKSPMGDPICVELRGYELALRASEANSIFVEVVR